MAAGRDDDVAIAALRGWPDFDERVAIAVIDYGIMEPDAERIALTELRRILG